MARIRITVTTTLHGAVTVDQHFDEIVTGENSDIIDAAHLRRSIATAATTVVSAHQAA